MKQHAPVLGYLQLLVSRLAVKDLDPLLGDLKRLAEQHNADQEDAAWDGLFGLLKSSEDRQVKHKSPKSALRKSDNTNLRGKPERRSALDLPPLHTLIIK